MKGEDVRVTQQRIGTDKFFPSSPRNLLAQADWEQTPSGHCSEDHKIPKSHLNEISLLPFLATLFEVRHFLPAVLQISKKPMWLIFYKETNLVSGEVSPSATPVRLSAT